MSLLDGRDAAAEQFANLPASHRLTAQAET
jgi:hypothetical protein